MNITEFEQRVIEQKPVGSGHYDPSTSPATGAPRGTTTASRHAAD
jgi:hypothetical protein